MTGDRDARNGVSEYARAPWPRSHTSVHRRCFSLLSRLSLGWLATSQPSTMTGRRLALAVALSYSLRIFATAFRIDEHSAPSDRRLQDCAANQYNKETSCDSECDDSCDGPIPRGELKGDSCDHGCDSDCDASECADYSPPAPPQAPTCACMINRDTCVYDEAECRQIPLLPLTSLVVLICILPMICRRIFRKPAAISAASPADSSTPPAPLPVAQATMVGVPVATATPVVVATAVQA